MRILIVSVHYLSWIEKQARERFFEILMDESTYPAMFSA